jgi:hypothetical protein
MTGREGMTGEVRGEVSGRVGGVEVDVGSDERRTGEDRIEGGKCWIEGVPMEDVREDVRVRDVRGNS